MSGRRLALLLALLVLTRGVLLACAADVFFFGEELGKGVAAKAMLDGLPVEHWRLIYVWHEGGGFVMSHLKALAFLAVGESILAHKLVALAFTALLLVTGVSLAREVFGGRAALLFGVLIVFCPESYLRFSLMNLGTHFEATLFVALVLRQTFRILRAQPGTTRDWAILGLASGFGLYFSLQTAPAIACASVYLLFGLRARILGRGLAAGIVGAIVGALPLLSMLSKVGLDAVRVRGQDALGGATTSLSGAVGDLFEPLRRNGTELDWIVVVLVPLCAVAGLVVHRERAFTRAWLGIAGYCALFVALYFGSGLAVGMGGHWGIYLRLAPLWFFATLLAAAGIDRWLASWPRLAGSAIGLLLIAGFDDLRTLARTGIPSRPIENLHVLATTKGVDYVEYFDKFVTHLDADRGSRVRTLLHLRDESDLLPASIAHSVFEKSDEPLADVLATLRASAGERFEESLLGLGAYLHPGDGYDFDAAYARVESAPKELRPLLAEAIGRAGLGPRFRRDRLAEQVAHAVPERWRSAWLRGTGWRVCMAYKLDPAGAEAFLEACAPLDQPALRAGSGRARASITLP